MLSRIVVLCSAVLLTSVFFFPLWRIGLVAPQYPEGLHLEIWADKVIGDIRNINVLNHYIGMSKVEPDKIPEFRMFPYAFGGLAVAGFLAGLLGRKILIRLWCIAILSFAVYGLYDFYQWEYHFGHDLSEDAPMKLEESYQPPLIGTKQILTITATSWPEKGGYAFSGAALLAVFVLLGSFLPSRKKE